MRLAGQRGLDYLVIESSGISEPLPVAVALAGADPASGASLQPFARIDTMVRGRNPQP